MNYRRFMALNINDMGGIGNHLMAHRFFSKVDGRSHINWKYWSKNIRKREIWDAVKEYIAEKNPDAFWLQEMLVSSYEEIDFIGEIEEMGYHFADESLPKEGNCSITMGFYRGEKPEYLESPGNGYRKNRSVIYSWSDLLTCGSHFPYESDAEFLKHMKGFVEDNLEKDFLLIGDANANNPKRGNKQMLNEVISEGAVDLWTAAGNPEDTPTVARIGVRLDYAIASPSLAKKVVNVELDSYPMDEGLTDHAAVIVDIRK